MISLAQALIESTPYDDVRFDAYRIMAEAYIAEDNYLQAKNAISKIPEIYFTKLEVAAELLKGDDQYEAAQKQKMQSAGTLVEMLLILGDCFMRTGENEKAKTQYRIAQNVIEAFKGDFLESKYFRSSFYDRTQKERETIKRLLSE